MLRLPQDLKTFNPWRRALLAAGVSGTAGLLLLMHRDVPAPTVSLDTNSIATLEQRRAAERGALCSAANATGIGLRGEYFRRAADRRELLLARVDGTVDFDASLEWPAQRAAQRPSAARWSGWVKPPITGRYRFHADQPTARVVAARQVMVGEGAGADPGIELAAGRFYPITLEVERLDQMSGRLRLEWTAPHGARYLVPRALLFVPNETAKS